MRRSGLVCEGHPGRWRREDSLDCEISWPQYDNYLEKCKINLTQVSIFGGAIEEKAGAEDPQPKREIPSDAFFRRPLLRTRANCA